MNKRNPLKEDKCSEVDEDFKHGQQDEGRKKTKRKTSRKAKRSRCMYSQEKPGCDSNSKDEDGGQASIAVKETLNGVRDRSFLDNKDVMVDVQLTVNASPRAENAPFVSLASEAYGVAVIGYPLDVGEIRDQLFGDLLWRTSKRSPVCYVTCASSKAGDKSFMKLLNNSKKPPTKTCVPVQLIFSKILAAVY